MASHPQEGLNLLQYGAAFQHGRGLDASDYALTSRALDVSAIVGSIIRMAKEPQMERRLFGTDGIRGTANAHPMTAEVALRLGKAAGRLFRRGDHPHRVVIGKDTRLSGYMLEAALQAGFTSAGWACSSSGRCRPRPWPSSPARSAPTSA
jgi:hypothetical protein